MSSGFFSTTVGGEAISLTRILSFLQFCHLAKPVIQWSSKDETSLPPNDLPTNVSFLLSRILKEDLANIDILWEALKGDVWKHSLGKVASPEVVKQYNKEALALGTCAFPYLHSYFMRSCLKSKIKHINTSSHQRESA